jgi:quinol-cytochrome oxidoreductase complex cytochrome b subunit
VGQQPVAGPVVRGAGGAGGNVLNYGQMLLFHVVLFPLVLGFLVIWHVLLVRRRGVVPPFEDAPVTPVAAEPEPTPAPELVFKPFWSVWCCLSG